MVRQALPAISLYSPNFVMSMALSGIKSDVFFLSFYLSEDRAHPDRVHCCHGDMRWNVRVTNCVLVRTSSSDINQVSSIPAEYAVIVATRVAAH